MTDYDSMFKREDAKKKEELSVFDTGAALPLPPQADANPRVRADPELKDVEEFSWG